jgi:energy-converting hydrogenase Eha subunit E
MSHVVLLDPGNWVLVCVVQIVVFVWLFFYCCYTMLFHLSLTAFRGPARYRRATQQIKCEIDSHGVCFVLFLFHALQFAATVVSVLMCLNTLGSYGVPVWQQCDSPHVLLVLVVFASHRCGRFDTCSLALLSSLFMVALGVSIAHLFLEIDNVNQDASWADLDSYLLVPRASRVLHLYRFAPSVGPGFVTEFAVASVIQHYLHVCFVGLCSGLCSSLLCLLLVRLATNHRCTRF